MQNKNFPLLGLFLAGLVISSCAIQQPGHTSTVRGNWVLTQATDAEGNFFDSKSPYQITLSITYGKTFGTGPCNSYTMKAIKPLGTEGWPLKEVTAIGCQPEIATLENRYLDALIGTTELTINNTNQLIATGETGTIKLLFETIGQ